MRLFRQFFSAQFKGLLIWTAVGILYVLAGTRSASGFVQADILTKIPSSMMNIIGDIRGLSSVDAYIALIIGKAMIVIPALYAVMLALSIVTREVDRRTVEFLLALPVERTQVLLARLGVLVVNVTLVVLAMWAVIRFDMAAQGYIGTWSHLTVLFVNIWLLVVALGALALAASMWVDDYSLGIKLFLGITTLSFFVEYGMKAATVSRAGRFWSPFSYASPTDVLRTGSVPVADVVVLVVAIIAGLGVSYWAFNRKQFSA